MLGTVCSVVGDLRRRDYGHDLVFQEHSAFPLPYDLSELLDPVLPPPYPYDIEDSDQTSPFLLRSS